VGEQAPGFGDVERDHAESVGGGGSGRAEAGGRVSVRRGGNAAVTAQMARAATTSMVCRAIRSCPLDDHFLLSGRACCCTRKTLGQTRRGGSRCSRSSWRSTAGVSRAGGGDRARVHQHERHRTTGASGPVLGNAPSGPTARRL
jgi:hypothetical protein